jgi:hypothetical protein
MRLPGAFSLFRGVVVSDMNDFYVDEWYCGGGGG